MSNLRAILDRLVQENLHGPIDPGSQQDTVKSHAIRQAQQAQTLGHARGAHADPYRDFRESQRHDIDLDAHDPRYFFSVLCTLFLLRLLREATSVIPLPSLAPCMLSLFTIP